MSKFLLVDTSQRVFEEDEHIIISMTINDRFGAATDFRISHWKKPKEEDLVTLLTLSHGCMALDIFGITPDQARELADKLYDFSATCDAHIAQIAREKQEAAQPHEAEAA